jgi:hypothetical protein
MVANGVEMPGLGQRPELLHVAGAWRGMAAAVSGLSPVIITVRDTHLAQPGEALANAAFDDVLEMREAEQLAAQRDRQRRATGFGDDFGRACELRRHRLIGIRRRRGSCRPPRRAPPRQVQFHRRNGRCRRCIAPARCGGTRRAGPRCRRPAAANRCYARLALRLA